MKVAIYKGKGTSKISSIYILLIKLYQRYILKSDNWMYAHIEFRVDDIAIGASYNEGGVFKRPAHNIKGYDYINMSIIPPVTLYDFYNLRKDYKYDLNSILLGNLMGTNMEDTNKYSCSEFVYEFLLARNIFGKHKLPYNITPSMVVDMLLEQDYRIE